MLEKIESRIFVVAQSLKPEAVRAYERSSAFRSDCLQGALAARPRLHALRAQIELETLGVRDGIRERKDADTWAAETNSIRNAAKIERTLDEMTPTKKAKVAKPALPVGVASLDDLRDEIANPELAETILQMENPSMPADLYMGISERLDLQSQN